MIGYKQNTLVTLWDLSYKQISDLEVGDKLLSYQTDNYQVGEFETVPAPGAIEYIKIEATATGFDNSHMGSNKNYKSTVSEITSFDVEYYYEITFTQCEHTMGMFDDLVVNITKDTPIEMSHKKGFECGANCPHIGYEVIDSKDEEGKLEVGDLGYVSEEDEQPKTIHGFPDSLDELEIKSINRIDKKSTFYNVVHDGTHLFVNNTLSRNA